MIQCRQLILRSHWHSSSRLCSPPPPRVVKQSDKRLAQKLLSYGNYDILADGNANDSLQPNFDNNYIQHIPTTIPRPPYARGKPLPTNRRLYIKTPSELQYIRHSCQLAARVLQLAGKMAEPGVTTAEIDRECLRMIVSAGAYPSPLAYEGYPRSICTSVNNVICHGVPDDRPLRAGDIVSIDVTVYKNGYHGDNCATFLVGNDATGNKHAAAGGVDEKGRRLVDVGRLAMWEGIGQVRAGQPFSAIGAAIEKFVRPHGYSIVRELCGHGIGVDFHELPYVNHYDATTNNSNDDVIMQPGMVFTIEPVLCQGFPYFTKWSDGWSLATVDNGRSVQWEHTVLVTDNTDDGYEVLTQKFDA